ncbi:MAG: protein kinase [Planctomycetes bacterium]|nr:protein kinase [Planctomycetota bacterium]
MSVPNSVEELLGLIRKSGVVDEQQLNAYLERPKFGAGVPNDVQEFLDMMIRDGILTNFQAEQYLLGKSRGFVIGPYKLLERVGVGGMGQVFLCEHTATKKRAAIKVLPPAKADQPAALGRFQREARAAAALEHPNVVRTHEIDQDGDLHFIVMDYIDGSNLMDMVQNFGAMDIARAVSYARQVAAGLDYAFRSKIIHRDIKPGNVLVDRKGVARILDMGLARILNDHADQLTQKYDDKIVLGTADYVAPEQVVNSHSVDGRADIYALGATLYFLLAGHPPFPTGTVSQKLLWHRTKDPTPIRAIRPEVPEGLAAVLAKMMAKDPKVRYQTPAQVVVALDDFLPAAVKLPPAEEMPQLSPAAREVVTKPDASPAPPAPSETGRGSKVSMAALPATRPAPSAPSPFAANPFASSSPAASPWGAPSSNKAQPAADDEDLPEAIEISPAPTRRSRANLRLDGPVTVDRDTFQTPKKSRSLLWICLGAVLIAVLAAWVVRLM